MDVAHALNSSISRALRRSGQGGPTPSDAETPFKSYQRITIKTAHPFGYTVF